MKTPRNLPAVQPVDPVAPAANDDEEVMVIVHAFLALRRAA